MADNSDSFHESERQLDPETIERHRAVATIIEELEAIDWYDQRIDATGDPQLRAVLTHNRDEEKEHAAMTLEWLRRHDAKLDEHLRTYLFQEQPPLLIEQHEPATPQVSRADQGSLDIGSLRHVGRRDVRDTRDE